MKSLSHLTLASFACPLENNFPVHEAYSEILLRSERKKRSVNSNHMSKPSIMSLSLISSYKLKRHRPSTMTCTGLWETGVRKRTRMTTASAQMSSLGPWYELLYPQGLGLRSTKWQLPGRR